MNNDELCIGREQSRVKHFILQKYLERFALIVGSRWEVLTYVDCFSGPWNARSEKFADSSFAIALNQLRNAREALANRGRQIKLRAFFLEKNRSAFADLEKFADSVTDARVETRNATLEESVSDICKFTRQGGDSSFPFIFIDPTGWTGFEMKTIEPLLRLNPGEVLINFMTGHIRRFLESPDQETQQSFERLFGSAAFKQKIEGLSNMEREDAAVAEYTRNAAAVGKFNFAASAIVLHPEMDRTHFHLIYLTRNAKGLEVFKEAERKAMEVQEAARAEAQQRKRVAKRGQAELFDSQTLHDFSHYEGLRERYLSKAKSEVVALLQNKKKVSFDDVWVRAVSLPMCWESDLKSWIEEWRDAGELAITGMQQRQRVPHRGEGNYLVWTGKVSSR